MSSISIAFIGGGNMASAIIGGLIRQGQAPSNILVIDPGVEQRERLNRNLGVHTLAEPGAALALARTVIWAIKPQQFKDAAASYRTASAAHTAQAPQPTLHLSVMAGIRSDDLARALGTECIVRTMPNTPALIGQGITGVYARPAVSAQQKADAQALLAPTGDVLWVDRETDLDAVTALSGSGPAYVFYLVEAMMDAAQHMGLTPEQGKHLALATFSGASELARRSPEPPSVLRERVTSKGGTTYAALTSLEASGVKAAFVRALQAAQQRARELGDEFGA